MSTKLIQTKDYLLLIDEEAEINNGAIISYDRGKNNMVHCDINDIMLFQYTSDGKNDPVYDLYLNINKGFTISSTILFETGWAKKINIIAYYPLTKEANELDLPLLPNPFEEVSIEKMAIKRYPLENFKEETWLRRNGFIEGYKAAQSKQFSLEDMKDILEEGLNWFGGGRDKEIRDSETWFNHYIQSLSTQQLPKEFVPEYEESCSCFAYSSIGCNFENNKDNITSRQDKCEKEYKLKTITNSEGKKELVGTYKY